VSLEFDDHNQRNPYSILIWGGEWTISAETGEVEIGQRNFTLNPTSKAFAQCTLYRAMAIPAVSAWTRWSIRFPLIFQNKLANDVVHHEINFIKVPKAIGEAEKYFVGCGPIGH